MMKMIMLGFSDGCSLKAGSWRVLACWAVVVVVVMVVGVVVGVLVVVVVVSGLSAVATAIVH